MRTPSPPASDVAPSSRARRRAARARRAVQPARAAAGSCAARASRRRARSRPRPRLPSGDERLPDGVRDRRECRSSGIASSSTSSRFVNSETAITRSAARTTRGTNMRLYVRVQRLNASGCRRTARSCTVSTTGTGERSGPRKLGQWSTSSPRARRGSATGYHHASRATRRGPARASPRQRLDLDEPLELRQQAAQVARRAGARLAKRRDVDADAHSLRVSQRRLRTPRGSPRPLRAR